MLRANNELFGSNWASKITGRSGMMNVSKTRSAIVLFLGALFCSAATSQRTSTEGPGLVTLSPGGACAVVAEDDIVTFEWNPALDHYVGGLSNFHLVFGRLEDGRIKRVGDRITLSAFPTRGQGDPVAGALPAPINGFSKMSFRVYLRGAAAGQYDLMEVRAETSPEETVAGTTPAITNSPLRYHFCLNVTTTATPQQSRQ